MIFLLLSVSAHVITQTECGGQFYVGLLRYSNKENLKYTGECCDGVRQVDEACIDYCDLIFDVAIRGLGGSVADEVTSKRPWDRPINNTNVIQFPNSYTGIRNPLMYQFASWPADVNITVSVYDKDDGVDKLILVDRFHTSFTHNVPTDFYIKRQLTGERSQNASILDAVFRYKCNSDVVAPGCFTDCIDHDGEDKCPMTSPHPIPTDVTYTGFPNQGCGDSENNNCTITLVTTGPPSNSQSSDATPVSPRSPVNTTIGPNFTNIANKTTTKLAPVSSTQTLSSTSVAPEGDVIFSNVLPTVAILTATRSHGVSVSAISNAVTGVTTPHQVPVVDDGMEYWPAIVGSVLGGLALLVAVAVVFYYKRQKKMQKRQEIYNVNPKILRKFECEENGTSGRADVPLETEPV